MTIYEIKLILQINLWYYRMWIILIMEMWFPLLFHYYTTLFMTLW